MSSSTNMIEPINQNDNYMTNSSSTMTMVPNNKKSSVISDKNLMARPFSPREKSGDPNISRPIGEIRTSTTKSNVLFVRKNSSASTLDTTTDIASRQSDTSQYFEPLNSPIIYSNPCNFYDPKIHENNNNNIEHNKPLVDYDRLYLNLPVREDIYYAYNSVNLKCVFRFAFRGRHRPVPAGTGILTKIGP